MAGFMLDTNICIYVLRRRPAQVAERFMAYPQLAVSVITLGELRYGVEKSASPDRNGTALADFVSHVEVLQFTAEAATHFAEIKAFLFRSGTPCGPYDMLIGAHARALGMTLVTNNRREFDRMPGLAVENWV